MELKKIKQITPDPQYVQGHSWPLCHSCGEAGEQLGWAWGWAPFSSHGPLSDSDCSGRKSLASGEVFIAGRGRAGPALPLLGERAV